MSAALAPWPSPAAIEGAGPLTGWAASLRLRFAQDTQRTALIERRHEGPLRVQKALYPEGPEVCHAIILHPPAGIAGGDSLDIRVHVDTGARALLTSPGATKWYRSAGQPARQDLHLEIAAEAACEWLPQETIVFSGALASSRTRVDLAATARAAGWDILCLGRTAAGERFLKGEWHQGTHIYRTGELIWHEQARLPGGSPLLDSPAGLQGQPVVGTLWFAAPELDASAQALLAQARTVAASRQVGVTALPGVLLARCLADTAIDARQRLAALWHALRPALMGRPATEPRIWHT